MSTWHIPSEVIEPVVTGAIGLIHNEYDESKKSEVDCRKFYYGMLALDALCVFNSAPHCSLAMSNAVRGCAAIVKADTGVCPIRSRW